MNNEFPERQEEEMPTENLLDLKLVLQAFGVSSWQNLGPVDQLGSQNQGIRIDIDGDPYLLRERPEGPIGENLHFRYQFQQYLQQGGIPVPTFRLTPEGGPTVLVGEDYFELQQYIGGELFSSASPRSLEWLESAGSMLGKMHELSRHYKGHQHRWPAEAHVGSVVNRHLQLARLKAEEVQIPALASALTDWAEQWEAVLPAAMMALGAGRNLPEWHIHGDYHALNVRFGPFGVSAVTGLEAARWEKRIFEVAYALFYFCALYWLPGSSATPPLAKRGFEPERAEHFLRGYAEWCPPAPGEASLLVDALLLISPVVTINGPLEDLFYASAEELAEASVDDLLERLNWAITLPAWLQRIRRALPELWA